MNYSVGTMISWEK